MKYQGYEKLLIEQQGKLLIVKFHNPSKKNCLNFPAYKELARVFTEVNNDENITIIALTGVGDYFTAGNDISQTPHTNLEDFIIESNMVFKNMVLSVINCKKIFFTIVNGPAIGIGATLAALSDVCWCSDKAYFLTPFSKLGLVAEGASTYTFPMTIGRSKAFEMLLLNEPMSAKEAYHYGLASRVFKIAELDSVIWPKVLTYSELPPKALRDGKELIRLVDRQQLIKANEAECEALRGRLNTDEVIEAIIAFANRKQKSKL